MPAVNSYNPHLFVLPEDDANRQIANGFQLHEAVKYNAMRVLSPAGGWHHVVDEFCADLLQGLDQFPKRFLVLLLDFDGSDTRLSEVQDHIPEHIKDRVFVLGVRTEPEDLKRENPGSLENIGRQLAEECRLGVRGIWAHRLLDNNAAELKRLEAVVKPFLIK
jgi:hypothetical protein